MQIAQQVHGIGKVSAGVPARRFQQGVGVIVASRAFGRDPRELGIGNADLRVPRQVICLARSLLADGPIDGHYYPLVLNPAKPCPTVTNARA